MNRRLDIQLIAIFSIGLLSYAGLGQEEIKDTIYISKHKMSHLVFHEPILMADYGSSVIATDGKAPKVTPVNGVDIVSVKARKKFKVPTNISVVTSSNQYYNIHCLYTETPKHNFYYFGKDTSGIGTGQSAEVHPDAMDEEVTTAKRKDSLVTTEITKYYTDTIRYKGVAKKLYSGKHKELKNYFAKSEKTALHFLGVHGIKDKLYIKLSVGNEGALPFRIKDWEFSIRKKGGFDSQQPSNELVMPVYEHNDLHQFVLPKNTLTKVFVFEQFIVDPYSSVYIQLREKELQRTLVLEIPSKYINRVESFELP